MTLGYGTSAGGPALRAQVAARHGIPDDQVLITSGAAAALFLLALLYGDGEILIGQPCYPPMRDALRGIGARIVTVQSQFGDGYRIDLDAFRAALSPRTQLVMFASPQNPSGIAITPAEVEQMLAAMSRSCPGAFLLIDETYREATYGDAPAAGTFAGLSPRLLTCSSLAKAYGTPGLRIGWLTVPGPELYEQLRLAKFSSSLSCGTLDEFLAAALLSRAEEILPARSAALAQARDIVERWIKAHTGQAAVAAAAGGGDVLHAARPGHLRARGGGPLPPPAGAAANAGGTGPVVPRQRPGVPARPRLRAARQT